MRVKLFVSALRFLSLAGRGSIIFIAARLLDPQSFSVFVIFSSSAAFLVLFNGFDFIRWFQREASANNYADLGFFLREFLRFLILSNFLCFVVLLMLSVAIDGYFNLLFIFFLYAFSEHLGQEANRVLIFLGRQWISSVFGFIRMGAPTLFLLVFFVCGNSIDFDVLVMGLTCFSMLAAVASWTVLLRIKALGRVRGFNWTSWVFSGLKYSSFFFVSTVLAKFVFVFDKYMVERIYGADLMASYSLVVGAAILMMPFVDILFGSYAIPRFYKSFSVGFSELKAQYHRQLFLVVMFLALTSVCGIFAVYYLFDFLFPGYSKISLLNISLVFVAISFFALATIPSIALIVLGKNRFSALSAVIPVAGLVIFVFFLKPGFTFFLCGLLASMAIYLAFRLVGVEAFLSQSIAKTH